MTTFLNVNLALLPFLIFTTLVARGMPAEAIYAALIASALLVTWRGYRGGIKSLELALLLIFSVLAIGISGFPEIVGPYAMTAAFAGLGAFAAATVLLGRPWTSEFSRAAYASEAGDPAFARVNMIVSGIWSALFLLLAIAGFFKAGGGVTIAVVVVGALTSILGPRWLIRQALAKRLAARENYSWRPPSLGGALGDEAFDVAVVGAGIGGLTAAALLADAGLKVLVAEQHFQPGGFCQSFQRKIHHKGEPLVYRFDAGPHDFSGVWPGGPVTSILERLGVAERIEWRRVDHSYRYPGLVIDVPRDWNDYVAELGRIFPAERSGLEALFATIRAIYDGMFSPVVGVRGVPGLGMTVDTMLAFARLHPLAVQWMDKPFDQLVAEHVADPRARQLITTLTGYISDGSETLSCGEMVPLFGYYFHGGYHPVGGSGRFAGVLADAIRERGGELRLNCAVKHIDVTEGRAAGLTLADGKRIGARAVVTNADLRRTFLELIDPRELPPDFRARIATAQPATSAFTVHLGVDFVPDIRPAVHLKDGGNIGITAISRIDPTAAPSGHSTLTLTALQPHALASQWFVDGSEEDWQEARQSSGYGNRKSKLGDQLVAAAEKIAPGLSAHIVYRDESSPVTFTRYDWSNTGSIYGVAHKDRLRGAKSPIPGLVVAGSSTHGPGAEAALISGAFAADALLPGLLTRPSSNVAGLLRTAA